MTGLHYLFILAFLSISPDLLGYSSRRFSMTASGSSSSPNLFHKTRDTDSSPHQNTNTHAHTHADVRHIPSCIISICVYICCGNTDIGGTQSPRLGWTGFSSHRSEDLVAIVVYRFFVTNVKTNQLYSKQRNADLSHEARGFSTRIALRDSSVC